MSPRPAGFTLVLSAVVWAASVAPAAAQSRAVERSLDALPKSCFFVLPPKKAPPAGTPGSLLVVLPGGGPLDLLIQNVELPEGTTVVVQAKVRTKAAKNAWCKVFLYGAGDERLHKDAVVAQLTGDSEWKTVEKSWPAKGATRAVVQWIVVGDGELWIDDVVLAVVK